MQFFYFNYTFRRAENENIDKDQQVFATALGRKAASAWPD